MTNQTKFILSFAGTLLFAVVLWPNISQAAVPSPTGYWLFQEPYSATRMDQMGSTNLTPVNDPVTGPGKVNNGSIMFSQYSQHFIANDNAAMSTGDIDFSVSAWIIPASVSAGTQTIASKEASATNREWRLYRDANRLKFSVFNSAGTETTVTAMSHTLNTSGWFFVIAWRDKTAGTINIQINNSATVSSLALASPPVDTNAAFKVGAHNSTSTNLYFGSLDELGWWKRVLNSTERTELYNSGNGWVFSVPPSCAGASPDNDWTVATTGTRTTTATGVANATAVRFGVWSTGVAVATWYTATNQGSGNWAYNVPLSAHTGNVVINVHAYMDNATNTNVFCDSASFTRLFSNTINVNSNMPTTWTLTCPLTNPTCPSANQAVNASSGSYPSKPASTWTIVPANKAGYDFKVNDCPVNTQCALSFP